MKKLMIATAVIIAAIAAQATSIDWAFTETIKPAAKGTEMDISSYRAYLFTEAAWGIVAGTASKDMVIEKDSFTGYLTSASISTAEVSPGVTSKGYKYTTGTQVFTDSSLQNANYYIVIADLENSGSGIWATSKAATTYDETSPTPASHTAAAWSIASGNTGSYLKSTNTAYTLNIPEPTSAMLLLIGVAGLALRRKQK